MTFNIALNFEDGVTRFIQCNAGEKVLDAAYRQKVNLPMDCSDGVCGTCKCHCASGEYDLGEDYLDEALSDDEAQARQVLTCQMVPTSDCVIDVPVAAAQCKTALTNTGAQVRQVNLLSDTAIELVVALDEPLAFLPGQYVNIQVPGTLHVRAYSFSSLPGSLEGRFLIRNVPGGMMSQWLTQRARPGDRLTLSGPMGSFYLRHGERPLLMLAGGTGLAPLLSMLHTLQTQGSQRPVMLLYGVTRDCDLVKTDALDTFIQQLTGYRWLPVVADENSTCPQRGFVTDHLDDAMLNNGDVDIYLCGPLPMVNAVATALRDRGITPAGFWYEKFIASQSAAA
ncbi:benzoate 1,2-dioxygenase electron transfer component BenC [Klebsiella pneumoniae]|uniref:benzoate 1,2-dioxygenase electron transfer component BenC n=1 Tax=Klebsiella pneumoniae TaxID=573 RepID=UPI002A5501EB|nr:ring-hydroxylating dioxygenase ferredoxin reductase family protein [Klebsiella pneumoniae]HEK7955571.1 ring-hydroxylating dioxygenase ferredoxin reductase family protein [Klebsiella pneumoniae]